MKILSAAPSNTEIIYALGLDDQLVGTTSLCDHPEEAREKPSVGGWSEGMNYERIEELDPDIVLLSDRLQDSQKTELEERGFKTFHVSPTSLEDVFESIVKMGEMLEVRQRAEELVENMRTQIEKVDLDGARIYCEEWSDPPMVSGNWIPDLIQEAGGEYFIEKGRSREFKLERLKQFDPEYIFLNVCGAGDKADPDEILEREGWQSITAVEEGKVYVIDDALLNRPGSRLVAGLRRIEGIIDEESERSVN